MKKLFFAFGLFVVSLAFGQMETVKFDRKLVYEQDTASSKDSKRSIRELGVLLEYYHSSSYGMLRIKPKKEDYPFTMGSYYVFFGKKTPFWTTIDAVDRTIAMNSLSVEDINSKVDLAKTNNKGKVGGVSCNYYDGVLSEEEKIIMEVCVDETSSYDNFSKVFSGNTKKGLILSMSIKEKGDKVTFNLAKNEPLNLSMTLDTQQIEKGFVEREKKAAAIETVAAGEEHDCSVIDASEEGYAVDPLLNVYSTNAYKNNGLDNVALFYQIVAFGDNEEDYKLGEGRKKTIALLKLNYKSILKNHLKTKHISKEEYKKLMKFFQEYVKEVEAFDPEKAPKIEDVTEVRALEPEEFEAEAREFPKYNSAYKTMHMEKKPNLALDDALRSENLKQAIPQFCSDIYGQVSVFENEELKKQLLHFMGQTCDLYLYPKVDNVYYDGTLDALRRSVLEIEKLRPSLSKKDLKNLRTLIENLD
ncbi:MAG: hypothetical protein HG457_002000 [Flavobacteriaceae bacterium]|nr:hypothetical protein [Flavobacteriaceae bacterium]